MVAAPLWQNSHLCLVFLCMPATRSINADFVASISSDRPRSISSRLSFREKKKKERGRRHATEKEKKKEVTRIDRRWWADFAESCKKKKKGKERKEKNGRNSGKNDSGDDVRNTIKARKFRVASAGGNTFADNFVADNDRKSTYVRESSRIKKKKREISKKRNRSRKRDAGKTETKKKKKKRCTNYHRCIFLPPVL